ncbi:very short patch repair endonuclease [Paenarthrobacter ureafaciens]
MTPAERSVHMSRIRSSDTKPELALRRALHAAGYRYRIHDKRLPGTPDIVFPGRKKVIFVNGCFWHGHNCGVGSRVPKTNTEFWADKRRRNQERDVRQRLKLLDMGWSYLDVWECELAAGEFRLDVVREYLEQ